VLRDVRDGIVSATSAEKDYAVAIAADGKSIDKKRTNQLREEAPWSTVAPSSSAP
jgi:N-methylhydantoinase B